MILLEIGNPWDYLNGTSHSFGIDAGGANKAIGGVYNLFFTGVGTLAVVMIAASIVELILAVNPQKRAQGKEKLWNRFFVLFLLGCSASLLTFIMKILNLIFGVS